MLKLDGASGPFPAWQYNTALLVSSVIALLIGGALFVDGGEHYACLSPASIVVQSGYFSGPQARTWDDVSDVRARCSIAGGRGTKPYPASTLTLSFRDGGEVPFRLLNGAQVSIRDYAWIRKILKGKNYRYHVDYTVVPESCPPALYPLLLNWQRG